VKKDGEKNGHSQKVDAYVLHPNPFHIPPAYPNGRSGVVVGEGVEGVLEAPAKPFLTRWGLDERAAHAVLDDPGSKQVHLG